MGNIGSTQPSNRTGRKVVHQKLENAKKTGVLSLREHKLDEIPDQVFHITTLTTLDVSKNKLTWLGPKLSTLTNLKSFNCDDNLLIAGSLEPISSLAKLQNLSAGGNRLGKPVSPDIGEQVGHKLVGKEVTQAAGQMLGKDQKQPDPLPTKLPLSLKQLKLNANFFSSVPRPIFTLTKLQKLDLSQNQLASVPVEIASLQSLNELNLDDNVIVSLPEEVGALSKLKSLSLKNNHISVSGAAFSEKNPQPLPASLFQNTPLIDLNLHGNPMTSTQLNQFDGYHDFLERRQKTNTKNIYGGALLNLDVCGLE